LDQQHELRGKYVTDLITEEAVKIIKNAKKKEPVYLFISHLATHAGNPGLDLEFPPNDLDRFSYIPNLRRRELAGIGVNISCRPHVFQVDLF
jgi:arylsulfatase B